MEKQFTDLTKLKRSQYKLINGGCDDYFRVRIVLVEENDNVVCESSSDNSNDNTSI